MTAATALALPLEQPPAPQPPAPQPPARVIHVDFVRPVPPPPPAVRLTERGRLALGGLLAAVIVVLVGLAGAGTGQADTAGVAGHAVVEPGQTLWDIAVTEAPAGSDPRVYLEDLLRVNGFAEASVPAWTVVLLPAT